MSKGRQVWDRFGPVLLRMGLVVLAVNVAAVAYQLTLLSPNPDALVNRPPLGTLIRTAQYIGAGLLLVYLLQSRLEGRPLAALGLRGRGRTAVHFSRGALPGGILLAALFSVHWALGIFRFEQCLWDAAGHRLLWIGLCTGLFLQGGVAFVEELFFRGYLLTYLERWGGARLGIIASSILFSFIHFYLNIAGSWAFALLPSVNLVLLGVLLCLLVLHHGSLWVSVGFHFCWNGLQYYVFPVMAAPRGGLFQFEQVPGISVLLTGGEFGLEGSLLLTGAVALVIAHCWRLLPATGRWRRG